MTGDFACFPRGEGAAETIAHASRALALDPGLSEAYVARLRQLLSAVGFRSCRAAVPEGAGAEPQLRDRHHWYGNYLSDMGKEEEALAEIRRALDLDPLSSIISRDVAWPLFFSRRYDEAIAQLDLTLAAFPGVSCRRSGCAPGRSPARRHRRRHSSIRTAEAARRQRARCELAWAYALAGRREDAFASSDRRWR